MLPCVACTGPDVEHGPVCFSLPVVVGFARQIPTPPQARLSFQCEQHSRFFILSTHHAPLGRKHLAAASNQSSCTFMRSEVALKHMKMQQLDIIFALLTGGKKRQKAVCTILELWL